MNPTRIVTRLVPFLMATLASATVLMHGGVFAATAQSLPATPQATTVASVTPAATMTVTATVAATVSPTSTASPTVSVTATATVAPSATAIPTAVARVSTRARIRPRKVDYQGGFALALVFTGYTHSCALTVGGIAYCWGDNADGQLGDGTTVDQLAPSNPVPTLTFSSLAAGENHTCGLTFVGAVWCWGGNTSGQLGNGSTTASLTPVQVVGTYTSIYTGGGYNCALAGDGTASCWGFNGFGQLGDQTYVSQSSPTAIVGQHFSSLALGRFHACGIGTDGVTRCWGDNSNGELGDNSLVSRLTLSSVNGGHTFTQISSFGNHTCGVDAGNVYCWGLNDVGQVGDGTTTNALIPARVTNIDGGAAGVVAGYAHACVFDQIGHGACWGNNLSGQLGTGSPLPHHDLIALIANNLVFVTLAAGRDHTCGLTLDGIYCWGRNLNGQLGDGTLLNRGTPIVSLEASDPPASSSGSSAPAPTVVPTRTAVPTATPVPLRYLWTRDLDPNTITVTSNRGYSRTVERATLDRVSGARAYKGWVRNSRTFDIYGVDENGLLVWADPTDTGMVSQINWTLLLTMDMPADAVYAIPVATPANGRILWDVTGTGAVYVVGSDRFLHAIPNLRTFQAGYEWANVIPVTTAQVRLMPVGAPIPTSQ